MRLHDFFLVYIMSLPNDVLIWPSEKNGVYSIRSAYHYLGNEKSFHIPEATTSNLGNI
jgi:hypothetical protein